MRTTFSKEVTKSLFGQLAGVGKMMSRGEKVNQMADEVERGLEQAGLLLGKDDLRGAHTKLEWIEDLFLDAVELAETTGTGALKATRAQVRDARRYSDEIQRLLREGDTEKARQTLKEHRRIIDEHLAPLRRVASYIKE